MSADPFSDILKLTRAQALLTGGFAAGSPWAIRFPGRDKIKFFAVVKGSCWTRLEGESAPGRLNAGDVGLLTVNRSYVLASDLSVTAVEAVSLFSGAGKTRAVLGDGRDFAYIGGHVELDGTRGRLLLDVLPPWIHIPAASPQAPVFRWLVDQLVGEGAGELPGAQLATTQLTQLLFIQILRAQLQAVDYKPAGWLRAIADPRIAPALRSMHGDPARSWTLNELARSCAMSRTTFAEYFRKVVGVAPLTYLTEWRMYLAERALREETEPIGVVARSLGYTSESAFSNAFKRFMGKSPKAYRSAAHSAPQ